MDFSIFSVCLLVCIAQVGVVTLGTLRIMFTMGGNSRMACVAGIIEMSLWLLSVSAVLPQVHEAPILGVCYVLGYAGGNVLGILVERRLAMGHVVARIISPARGADIALALRQAGYPITTLAGEGSMGPVTVLFVVCRRRDLKQMIRAAKDVDPAIFYTFDTAGGVSHMHCPQRGLSSGPVPVCL